MKYIFIYQAVETWGREDIQGFDFVDVENEDSLDEAIAQFIKNKPGIYKLIVVNIKDAYKVPIIKG